MEKILHEQFWSNIDLISFECVRLGAFEIYDLMSLPLTKIQGNKYRALGRGIWVVDSLIEDLWERYKAMPKLDTRKKVESRCKVFITSLVNTFFRGGSGGLELPNYYRDHPNPLTALKIGRMRGKLYYVYKICFYRLRVYKICFDKFSTCRWKWS